MKALDCITKDFEIFKSKVANAVLDYLEMQSDKELVECLEKTSMFLNNISFQMEKVFECQEQASRNHNDLFEIGDDLFQLVNPRLLTLFTDFFISQKQYFHSEVSDKAWYY